MVLILGLENTPITNFGYFDPVTWTEIHNTDENSLEDTIDIPEGGLKLELLDGRVIVIHTTKQLARFLIRCNCRCPLQSKNKNICRGCSLGFEILNDDNSSTFLDDFDSKDVLYSILLLSNKLKPWEAPVMGENGSMQFSKEKHNFHTSDLCVVYSKPSKDRGNWSANHNLIMR